MSVVPDSTSTDSGFHNQQPGFWITIMVGFQIPLAGFRIPKPWIPDSTDQNYLDSGFRITLHEGNHLILKMVVKMTIANSSPSQDYNHPNDLFLIKVPYHFVSKSEFVAEKICLLIVIDTIQC